ncbi:hypothetical protein [Metabacillus fastidiosus]|uniref:Phage protein n=1 Tax=Metabacillus fastidiosus TaxID=1458 RepID=A0ABU6NVG2_9BACI|nr:hypothetical protein [Metabacillus fastidiosus]
MAIIALKQEITVHRPAVKDEWGNETAAPTKIPMKCRVDEVTTKVQNRIGEEVISGMLVYFDKLADIRYDDELEYTNELGLTVKRQPIKIEPARGWNTKAKLTLVYC